MESLFTVDADAIKNAIRFDESAMTGGLSGGMDVSDAFSMDPSVLDFGAERGSLRDYPLTCLRTV